MNQYGRSVLGLLAVIGLIVFPHVSPDSFWVNLLTQVLIFGILCVGYDLVLGYTGMLSFGHAAFFGLGAYGCALFFKHVALSFPLGLLAGIVLGSVAALFMGLLSVKRSSIYFAILTLAFAELIYAGAIKLRDFTGGVDGLMGIPRPSFLSIDLMDTNNYYYFVLVFLVLAYVVAAKLVSSPFGQVMKAIRINEQRTELVGFNTFTYKIIVFVISGAYAALAGGLFSPFLFYVSPDLLKWTVSGDVLLMTLVGGAGSLIGPVLGAGFVEIIKDSVSSYTEHWMGVMGLIYVVFVIFIPGGIVGSARMLWAKIARG